MEYGIIASGAVLDRRDMGTAYSLRISISTMPRLFGCTADTEHHMESDTPASRSGSMSNPYETTTTPAPCLLERGERTKCLQELAVASVEQTYWGGPTRITYVVDDNEVEVPTQI